MPNNKYKRSVRRERELVNQADTDGFFLACRTAGSKSKGVGFKTDIILIDVRDKRIILGQIKTQKGGQLREVKDLETLDGFTLTTRLYNYS